MRDLIGVGGVLASLIFLTSPALALEPKQCLPMVEMNAALKAEGQRTLILGDRVALRNDASRDSGLRVQGWVNTFTSNDDGSLGYNLEGDRPSSERSTRVCVAGKFTNMRLYDARRAGTPPRAKRGGAFDETLRRDEALGTRPMLQADSVSARPSSEVQRGLSVTLLGNTGSGAGFLLSHQPDGGAARQMFMMDHTAYTPAALERLN